MAADLFTVGPGNNFHILVDDFKDHIMCFGDAADEILRGERISYPEPSADDVLESGQRRYALQYHAATKDREERYGPELSDSGASALLSDKNYFRDQRTDRLKNSRALVVYSLSRLSVASKAALSTLKGSHGFDACKAARSVWVVAAYFEDSFVWLCSNEATFYD